MIKDEEDLIEKVIIKCFLEEGLSIRRISEIYGYGRTKVRNILEKYKLESKENEETIKKRLYEGKTHKKIDSIDEIDQEELTEEDIMSAYKEIIEKGKTLTEVATERGKNRQTIRLGIIRFLEGDNDAIEEFTNRLKNNQIFRGNSDFDETLSQEEMLDRIFSRLNYRRQIKGRNPYAEEFLERKANRLIQFFEKRNSTIENPEGHISKEQLLRVLYDYPTMLALSLNSKIKPALEALEKCKGVGKENASKIIKENPSVLGSSIERTNLQFRILNDTDTLKFVLDKPRILRTSPELLYAQIKIWKEKDIYPTPFVDSEKLYNLYNIDSQRVQDKYDVKEQYGKDEYFDRL